MPRCYVASPLGFSEPGRHYYAEVFLPALGRFIEPVDPWALVSDQEILDAVQDGRQREFAAEIGQRNLEALRSCQMLVAVLDGQEIDSGTAAEIGFAAALKLRCFGLRTDHRSSGEPGATVNLQVEAFVVSTGGRIASSLDELLADIERYLGQDHAQAGNPLERQAV